MSTSGEPYYRRALALAHHRGFGFHAEACAPGILALLKPVRRRRGLVLELGCGSGLLTKELVEAGHRVVATDASPAMLELARDYAGEAEEIRQLVLPDDPLPRAEAIVSVGHVLNYLADETALSRALAAIASSLLPGGLFAFDICDLEYGEHRRGAPNQGWVGDDWVLVTRFALPAANKFVREMTTFWLEGDGCWRRDDERHENVLIDTTRLPALLSRCGLEATVARSFGPERLPVGLRAVIGRRRP